MPGDGMRPTHITCTHCGEPASVAGDGPIPKYCSASCRSRYSKARAKATGKAEEWERNRLARQVEEAEKRTVERRANARPCPYCGDLILHLRRIQCGAPECKRAFNAERMREFQRRYKEKHGFYQTRLYDRPRQYAITCEQCGIEAVVTKADAAYCSHACFYDARYGVNRTSKPTRIDRARRRLERDAEGTAGEIVWVAGHCSRCGEAFTRRRSGAGVQHCSKVCRQRDAASRRRALVAGATVGSVSRWRVHERDGWTCHICGDPVDRDAVVPDLAAPVLDHVIPLARGGSHSEDNLKTAHFYCNSVKRDLVAGWSAIAA